MSFFDGIISAAYTVGILLADIIQERGIYLAVSNLLYGLSIRHAESIMSDEVDVRPNLHSRVGEQASSLKVHDARKIEYRIPTHIVHTGDRKSTRLNSSHV